MFKVSSVRSNRVRSPPTDSNSESFLNVKPADPVRKKESGLLNTSYDRNNSISSWQGSWGDLGVRASTDNFQEVLSQKLGELARTLTHNHQKELEGFRHDAHVQREKVRFLQDELRRSSVVHAKKSKTPITHEPSFSTNNQSSVLAMEHTLDLADSSWFPPSGFHKQDLPAPRSAPGSSKAEIAAEEPVTPFVPNESADSEEVMSMTSISSKEIDETKAMIVKSTKKAFRIQVAEDGDATCNNFGKDEAEDSMVESINAGEQAKKKAQFTEDEVEVKGFKVFEHQKSGGHIYKDVPLGQSTQHQRRPSLVKKISEQFRNACFEAYPVWYEEADPHLGPQFNQSGPMNPACASESDDYEIADLEREDELCITILMWRCTIAPNCSKRLMWDLLCILFNAYEIIVLPLAFFKMTNNSSAFLLSMSWVTRVFWTLDIPASFLTGYVLQNGDIELRPANIAYRYAKSWLGLDAFIVVADWLEYFMEAFQGGGVLRLGRTMRTVRMIRMLRLLRLIRMPQVFKRVTERFITDRLLLIGHIVRIMFSILAVSHITGCLWYGLGEESSDSDRWVNQVAILDKSFGFKYSYSLNWGLSTLTSGNTSVNPETVSELLFNIVFLLFAFTLCAAALSSITSSMTRLDLMAGTEVTQFAILRRYMNDNGISPKLFTRVMRASQQGLIEKRRLTAESDVELLMLVSEPLRVEIHFEIYSPLMCNHPFFNKYKEDNQAAMHMICHKALEVVGPLSQGDIVFYAGEIPFHPRMMFVMSGTFHYLNAMDGNFRMQEQGGWISEHTLWVPWRHCGEFRAASEGRLVALDADHFQQLVTKFFSTAGCYEGTHPSKYALEFVKRLNLAELGTNSDVTEAHDIQQDLDQAYCKTVRFRVSAESKKGSILILPIVGVELGFGEQNRLRRILKRLPCMRRHRQESKSHNDDRTPAGVDHRRRGTGAGMSRVASSEHMTMGMGRTPTGGKVSALSSETNVETLQSADYEAESDTSSRDGVPSRSLG